MKATDLMIGDWVLQCELNTPVKVQSIMCHYADEDVYFYHETSEYISNVSKLEPIPLTPEILEKNGFKSNYNEEFTIDDKYSIYMSILNPQYTATPRVTTGDIEDGDGGIYFNLSYVHELQHCLKLCGIEKEIVL